jgi:CheY-like chemotaxis protein
MGYSEMALGKMEEENQIYKFLTEIHQAAKRSTELTRQLLAFARRQVIDPKVLDINKAVGGMIKMLKRMIGEDINLVWHPGRDIWPVRIDPSQVDQILVNLCVNARDAISSVGKIVIETATVEFDNRYCAAHQGFVPGQFVQLTVTDDGKGMDRETQEKIFEPFFSTKGPGSGTGLGLATVYGIVKQNSGFVNVYSELGKGACFKIFFPRAEGQATEPVVTASGEIPKGHNETLLVVEDEPALLSLAESMLEELGYRVMAANSPEAAIAIAEAHPEKIDLLVTDVIMPGTTGRDLGERLQADNPDLGVLYMSGYTSNIIAHRGVLNKNVLMVQKPFSLRDLAVKIREALSRVVCDCPEP